MWNEINWVEGSEDTWTASIVDGWGNVRTVTILKDTNDYEVRVGSVYRGRTESLAAAKRLAEEIVKLF